MCKSKRLKSTKDSNKKYSYEEHAKWVDRQYRKKWLQSKWSMRSFDRAN